MSRTGQYLNSRLRLCYIVIVIALLPSSCVHQYREVHVADLSATNPVTVSSPVKAHLKDGAVVVYPGGALVSRDLVEGRGKRYDALRLDSTAAALVSISMDSILGLETHTQGIDAGRSFSTLLEGRDVDRLAVQADVNGRVQLEIRNEALETHMINQVELLEVRHAPGESVVPDARGRPLVLGARQSMARATDRSNREVLGVLAARDTFHFASTDALLAHATVTDFRDHIDLTLPRPSGHDSIGLVLRLRNSLLNTVLFYDLMLGSQAPKHWTGWARTCNASVPPWRWAAGIGHTSACGFPLSWMAYSARSSVCLTRDRLPGRMSPC
jgi:hypothetical protein